MTKENAHKSKIKEALQNGRINPNEVERRLEAAIEAELQKDDPDMALIEACEKLLWEIGTDGAQPFVSSKEAMLTALRNRIQIVEKKRFCFAKPKAKFAALAAAAVILLLSVVIPLSITWFEGKSTLDEQQYVIRGSHVEVELIQRSLAEGGATNKIHTSDWDEMTAFLGFEPTIPNGAAIGLPGISYTVGRGIGQVSLDAQYSPENINDITLTYSVHYFADPADVYFATEQNANGEKVFLQGCTVYVTENIERYTYVWHDDVAIYILSGQINPDMGLTIINEMLEENTI